MTRALPVITALAILCACSPFATGPGPGMAAAQPPAPVTYVALGASETAGTGTRSPARDSFPAQLAPRLGRDVVLYNLGIAGETTQAAFNDELPEASRLHANVATVFFNVDDLVAGVSPADFEAHLDQIVSTLRSDNHVRVLVAGTPPIDQLPVFKACQERNGGCPLQGVEIPSADEVTALIDGYNAATRRVVSAHGAILVDLSAAGSVIAQHPDYLGPDGFHPSAAGAAVLAAAFSAAPQPPSKRVIQAALAVAR